MENIDNTVVVTPENFSAKAKKNKRQIRILAIVLSVIFVLMTSFIVLGMFAGNVYIYTGVEGPSMKPTINNSATNYNEAYDYVYVNTYQLGTYNDIIVINHINNEGKIKHVIKRLIGKGGDTIKIDNTGVVTKVYRNDVLLQEDYLDKTYNSKFRGIGNSYESQYGITSVTIPKNYIFYLGDNRNNSEDCRSYANNKVPYCEKVSNIVGRVDYIIPHDELKKGDGKDTERFFNGIKEIFNKIF